MAKAQDWYRVAILLEPENGDHYYRLARISAEQGEPEAAGYYAQALAASRHIEFGRSNILTRLGELEKRKSSTDWNEVLARFDEAIQLNEFVGQQDIIQARSNKAEALDRLGKYRAALDEYESLAGDYPGNYWANVHSGRLVWQLKSDAPTAIAYLEKAIQNNDKPKCLSASRPDSRPIRQSRIGYPAIPESIDHRSGRLGGTGTTRQANGWRWVLMQTWARPPFPMR